MMDITAKLRAACGHDSRSVEGCINCEAADLIERWRAESQALDRAHPWHSGVRPRAAVQQLPRGSRPGPDL